MTSRPTSQAPWQTVGVLTGPAFPFPVYPPDPVALDSNVALSLSMHLTCLHWVCSPQVFEQGAMRGHWKMTYCDRDFRVFYSNKDNLFVLRRTA
jgi:hypothetical protein